MGPTVTGIAADSPAAAGGRPRLQRRLASVAAMLIGGLIGALVAVRGSTLAFILAPLLLLPVSVGAGLAARPDAGWTRPR
ncbi:MAG: hypothetical protein ABI473_03175 [Candidatus Dormibacter sp.]